MELPSVEATETQQATMAELSFDAMRAIVQRALDKKYPMQSTGAVPVNIAYVSALYPTSVVYVLDGKTFQTSYAIANQEATLGDPVEVTESWVKASEVKNGLIRLAIAYTENGFEKIEEGKLKKFNITLSDLKSIKKQIESGREIPIDYEHLSAQTVPAGWSRAAGWIQPVDPEIETLSDGRSILWGWFEPTPSLLASIKAKEFRYFSPEIHWNTKDAKGNPVGTQLKAGAITNRPFLKDLPPIEIDPSQYSELVHSATLSESKRTKETTKVMAAKKLKLKKLEEGENKGQTGCFDESGEMVGLAEKESGGKPPKMNLKLNKEGEHSGKVGVFQGDEMVGLADHKSLKSATKALTEYDPSEGEDDPDEAEKKMKANERAEQERSNAACLSEIANAKPGEVAAMQSRMVQENRLTLSGYMKAQDIGKLIDDGMKAGKILPKQRSSFFVLATANFKAAEAFLTDMARPQVDTRTRGIEGTNDVVDPKKEIELRVNVLMTDRKMSYSEAYAEVIKTDSYLAEQYEKQRARETAPAAR